MPTRAMNPGRPPAVSVELGGKWVAWNAEHSAIVAQAETLPQLRDAVQRMQVVDPVFEKIPRADVRFVGTK